jgi:hypothetical protein
MSEFTVKLGAGYSLDSLFEPGHYAVTDPSGVGGLPSGDYFVTVQGANMQGVRRVSQEAVNSVTAAVLYRIQATTGWGLFIAASGGGASGTAALTSYTNAPLGFGLANNVESALDFITTHGVTTPIWVASSNVEAQEMRRHTISGIPVQLRSLSTRVTGGAFDATEAANWTLATQESFGNWSPLTVTVNGFYYLVNNVQYSSLISGQTGLSIGADVIANTLKIVTKDTFTPIVLNAYYPARFTVQVPFMGATVYLQKRLNGYMSSTLDATALGLFQYVSQDKPTTFAATTLVPEGLIVLDNKVLYRSKTNHVTLGTLALDLADWDQLTGAGGASTFDPWVASTLYASNQVASTTISGAVVYMISSVAHTSETTFSLLESAQWIAQYQPVLLTTYPTGAIPPVGFRIKQNGFTYRLNTAIVLGANLNTDIANWTLEERVTTAFSASTYYPASGEISTTMGGVSVRLARSIAGVTPATIDTDLSNWLYLSQSALGSFVATSPAIAGLRILFNGVTYERITSGVTLGSFTLDVANWKKVAISYDSYQPWVASTTILGYETRQITLGGVDVYMVSTLSTSRTSAATFNSAEQAQWQIVGQSFMSATYPTGVFVPVGFKLRHRGKVYRYIAFGPLAALTNFVTDFADWSVEEVDLGSFAVSTYYPADAEIKIGAGGTDVRLIRITAGVSSPTSLALDGALWDYVSQKRLAVFSATSWFPANIQIIQDGAIYERLTQGTSLATFALDISNWKKVADAIERIDPWVASTLVQANEVRSQTIQGVTCYIIATAQATTGATFDATEATNWKILSQPRDAVFVPTAVVLADMRFVANGILYRCNATGTTLTTLPLDIANYTVIVGGGDALTDTVNQTAHAFVLGQAINRTTLGTWIAADVSNPLKTADAIVSAVVDVNNFKFTTEGTITFLAPDVDAVTVGSTDRFAPGQFKVGEYYHFNNAGKWTVVGGSVYSQVIAKALTTTTARIMITKPEAISPALGAVRFQREASNSAANYPTASSTGGALASRYNTDTTIGIPSGSAFSWNAVNKSLVYDGTSPGRYRLEFDPGLFNGNSDVTTFQWFDAGTSALVGTVGASHSATSATARSGNSPAFLEIDLTSLTKEWYVILTATLGIPVNGSTTLGHRIKVEKIAGFLPAVTSTVSVPVVQVFNASGTYTPTVGMKWAIVEMVGGGAAGTTVGATGGSFLLSIGSGGSSGGYIKALLTAAQIGASQSVTVGAGGTTTGGAGNPGGASLFGALLQANGGNGGSSGLTPFTNQFTTSNLAGGGGFTVFTGVDLGSTAGGIGLPGSGYITNTGVSNISALSGKGGDSKLYNAGGSPAYVSSATMTQTIPGGAGGVNTGCGGGGGLTSNTAPQALGGVGGSGKVIVTEYFG